VVNQADAASVNEAKHTSARLVLLMIGTNDMVKLSQDNDQ